MVETSSLVITEEFQAALDLMENSNASLFLTGKAGTGKSTLIDLFKERTKKNVVTLAPTGVAALNVEGVTLHSFFRLPIGTIDIARLTYSMDPRLVLEADTFIIDEISMVRADVMDAVDTIMRFFTRSKVPFGGKQMIFVGDCYQLPPVIERDTVALSFLMSNYDTHFWFGAPAVANNKFDLKYLELTHIFRQDDEKFIRILNAVRENDQASKALRSLSRRVVDEANYPKEAIYLAATNAVVDRINNSRLAALPGAAFEFSPRRTGIFPASMSPTDEPLVLKIGAQVMCLINNAGEGYVNGHIGTVVRIDQVAQAIEIELQDSSAHVKIGRYTWKNYRYGVVKDAGGSSRLNKSAVGTYQQFPLRLAWAITIHKAQGKTFERAIIDLGRGAFDAGQTYVALSRLRSMEGLFLTRSLRPSDVSVHEEVREFLVKMIACRI